VLYVADIVGGSPGFAVTLLSVVPRAEEDFFASREEQSAWEEEKAAAARRLLENYRQVLVQAGFPPEKVHVRIDSGEQSCTEAILGAQCDLSCCTIVVGRHHKSKTEEFLLGSTSSKLVHDAKNCAVWVVE
jgi:nucleotide-binding universal stress UspA family protein